MEQQGTGIGQRLARLRRRKALSQADLGALSGVGEATVNRIEKGHVQPRHVTIRKIAAALGVDPEELTDADSDARRD